MGKESHPRIKELREHAEQGGRDVHFDTNAPVRRGYILHGRLDLLHALPHRYVLRGLSHQLHELCRGQVCQQYWQR